MTLLITYDVCTIEKEGRTRLRQVAQACKDYGTRVQKSVFECQVGEPEWVQLRHRLVQLIAPREDSLRIYFLDARAVKRTEHHGIGSPLDLSQPLVL